jgi:hypothetical protein
VNERVDVDSVSATRKNRAKRAAIYYCASLLAPVVNVPTSDAAGGMGSYTRKVMSPEANAARLLALAESEISIAAGGQPPAAAQANSLPGTMTIKSKVVW